ncbi:hypothetical protein C9374_011604 [Naegleria lovaniensis]|uniref:Uncharacterized protein n=1 Tax=Naegleria lovaniensis TaxID=51637 RepID=A0AA88KET0_NAELO|nr:uncharacterized protein C9374_011604 [Naegleria lovaniensis]KAG2373939.1 hypothetical protein C9374_011604 [Naegleria lovaniensis]
MSTKLTSPSSAKKKNIPSTPLSNNNNMIQTPSSKKKKQETTTPSKAKSTTPETSTTASSNGMEDDQQHVNKNIPNSTPLKCIFSTLSNNDTSKFKFLQQECVDEIIDLDCQSSQQFDSEYILTVCKKNNGNKEFYTLNFTPQDLKNDDLSKTLKVAVKKNSSNSSILLFQNEYIDINQDHVLHTLKGTSLSISLKKYLLKYSSSLNTIEYKYSNSHVLLYLDTSTNTLYSFNYIQNVHSPLVTFKKEFKNISIFNYGHANNVDSKSDSTYYVVSMHDHFHQYIQIWNSTFNCVMKYSTISNSHILLSYQHPYIATSQCVYKLFKFTPIPFTKPMQLRNRHLTNPFIEIPKQEHNGFVYSIHDSTQWNQLEQEMVMKKNNLLRLISNQSLTLCIKQLPLIEYYQILLEYIYQHLRNESTPQRNSGQLGSDERSMKKNSNQMDMKKNSNQMDMDSTRSNTTLELLDGLFYLLSNYNQIQKSTTGMDGTMSIHISIMNQIIQYLLENYTRSHRPCLDLILKLNMLNDEQIISYLNVYGNDKYEYGIQLVLDTQYRNVQVLSMMKHIKVLSFEIIELILRLLSGKSVGENKSKTTTGTTTTTTTRNDDEQQDESSRNSRTPPPSCVSIESCMVWTQVLIHSHFGDFLRKKECLNLLQDIQLRIHQHVHELKQLALVKSELGVITSGMILPKQRHHPKLQVSEGGLRLNGAHWNQRQEHGSDLGPVVNDYHVSVNVYY